MSSSATKWNGKHFRSAFEQLILPITTANNKLVDKWSAEEVWMPYWATVQDTFAIDSRLRELLNVVMNSKNLTTENHRRLLQKFADEHVPGYTLLYEADILPAVNGALENEGSNERVLGFRYGKVGRCAIPDRYYQLLLKNKFMIIGNHHDVLGHLVIFCDPQLRSLTERLALGFSAAAELHNRLRRHFHNDAQLDARTEMIRRTLRLYNIAWNLIQEKLYVKVAAERPVLNLLGAFNSVYNPIFSDRIKRDDEQVRSVAGALGFFNRNPTDSLIMSPKAMSDFSAGPSTTPLLQTANIEYRRTWSRLGFDPDRVESGELCMKFEKVVENSFFQRQSRQQSVRARWLRLSDLILDDDSLSRLFDKSTLMAFSKAMIVVAEGMTAREQAINK